MGVRAPRPTNDQGEGTPQIFRKEPISKETPGSLKPRAPVLNTRRSSRNDTQEGATPFLRSLPTLVTIGGGKGGVGKSMVSTNLSVMLAHAGKKVVLVDGDLGGANLHTCLGLPAPAKNLDAFMSRRCETLDEIATDTEISNLRFIGGAVHSAQAANPKYGQKIRLLRHLRAVKADVVVLDLGAGTGFNTLDLYLSSSRGIVVVLPEPTSVENAYRFMKLAALRLIRSLVQQKRCPEELPAALKMMEQQDPRCLANPAMTIAGLYRYDKDLARWLYRELQRLEFNLVVNQVRSRAEEGLGKAMESAARERLGLRITHLANVPYDDAVWRSVRDKSPICRAYPDSAAALALQKLLKVLQP